MLKCTHSPSLPRHVHGKFDSYVFRLSWGVRCFDYREVEGGSHLLVTGSNDKIVRIWNPVVTTRQGQGGSQKKKDLIGTPICARINKSTRLINFKLAIAMVT